jgi:hypothetical protein
LYPENLSRKTVINLELYEQFYYDIATQIIQKERNKKNKRRNERGIKNVVATASAVVHPHHIAHRPHTSHILRDTLSKQDICPVYEGKKDKKRTSNKECSLYVL